MNAVLYFQQVTTISAPSRVSNRKLQFEALVAEFLLCAVAGVVHNFPH